MMQLQTDVKGSNPPPLVLIGGGLTGWLSWVPHQERLAPVRQVVRAQPLSVQYGLENRPLPEGYSMQLESDALAAAIDHLDWSGPVDLVGWSHSGAMALDYALDHPERVRTLTLIEPGVFWVLDATDSWDQESKQLSDEGLALFKMMTGDITEEQMATFVRLAGLSPPGKAPQEMPQWPIWLEHRRSLRTGTIAWDYVDTVERLEAFDRPVLLVKGTGSTHLEHRMVDVLASRLQHAEVVEFPGGHAPHIVSIDAFLEKLTAFQDAVELEERW